MVEVLVDLYGFVFTAVKTHAKERNTITKKCC